MDEVRAAAAYWQQRAIQAERDALLTKIALVNAVGGEIIVSRDHLHDAIGMELIVAERLHDDTVRFHTKAKDQTDGR